MSSDYFSIPMFTSAQTQIILLCFPPFSIMPLGCMKKPFLHFIKLPNLRLNWYGHLVTLPLKSLPQRLTPTILQSRFPALFS